MSQNRTNANEDKVIVEIYFENTGNFAIFALMNEKHQ